MQCITFEYWIAHNTPRGSLRSNPGHQGAKAAGLRSPTPSALKGAVTKKWRVDFDGNARRAISAERTRGGKTARSFRSRSGARAPNAEVELKSLCENLHGKRQSRVADEQAKRRKPESGGAIKRRRRADWLGCLQESETEVGGVALLVLPQGLGLRQGNHGAECSAMLFDL